MQDVKVEPVSKSIRVALYGESSGITCMNRFSSSNNISRDPRCFVYHK